MGLLTAICGSNSMGSATLFTGEMAEWLRALVALPEDAGSVLSTYTVASRHLSLLVHGIQCLFLTTTGVHMTYILTLSHTRTHKINIFKDEHGYNPQEVCFVLTCKRNL